MRKGMLLCVLLSSLAMVPASFGQDDQKPSEPAKTDQGPAHYYRMTFTVQEVNADGKPTNSRSYNTMLSTQTRQVSIRNKSRVPIPTGPLTNGIASQYQYEDLGVDIDVQQVAEVRHDLALTIVSTVNRLAKDEDQTLRAPITRYNTWNSPVLVPIGKPTVVFSSDDLDSKGSLQMVVTATPVQ